MGNNEITWPAACSVPQAADGVGIESVQTRKLAHLQHKERIAPLLTTYLT